MRTVTANDAKRHFGEMLDIARREPVSVEKHGRPVVVVLSVEDYAALTGDDLGAASSSIGHGAGSGQKAVGKTRAATKKRKAVTKPGKTKSKKAKPTATGAPKKIVEDVERAALRRDHDDLFGDH